MLRILRCPYNRLKDGRDVNSLSRRTLFNTEEDSLPSFLLGVELNPGPVRREWWSKLRNFNDLVVFRTRWIFKIWGFHGGDYEECTSSGLLRRVPLVRTDVSEELRVRRIVELGTMLAVTSNRRTVLPQRRFLQESHGVTSQKTAFSSGYLFLSENNIPRKYSVTALLSSWG
jgi:hypothetical protein